MIRPMNSKFTLSLILSIGVTTCVWTNDVHAANNAVPQPKERQSKNFDEPLESTPVTSRFHRRPDYREEEKLKAAQAEEAKKQAIENQQRQHEMAAMTVKKREQASIDANNKGVALGSQKRWLEAISAHEQAVQLDPRNKQFRINLSAARTAYGQEKMQHGDLNAAAALFRKALAAASDNGLAAKMLVEAMRKQGKDPSNVDLRLDIGDQLAYNGDLEGATIEFQAAMQLEPSARTFVKMGDMALRYQQIGTAANWYRQAIVKDPNHGPAHRQLGMLAIAQRDYTGAASSLRKAVVLDPKDAAAGQALVEIWRRQVAQNPLLAENHLGLAGALQLTGDFVGAESEYRKLETLDPRHPGLEHGKASLQRALAHAQAEKHKAAADTLFGQGLHREALAEISRAASMEPKNARYQFLLAECLEAVGDYQRAHQAYLACVLMDPENNKEAAARMKDMQRGLAGRIDLGQQATQIANVLGQQKAPQAQAAAMMQQQAQMQQQHAQMQQQQAQMQQQQAGAMQPVANFQSTSAPAAQQQASQVQVPQQRTTGGGMSDIMSKVSAMEAQKDYVGAISALRAAVQSDLKNADLHHRLAVDLLANGEVTEAISEFRMSSALRPDNQEFAADLARAMQIHKRSVQASSPEVAK
jgi:tetratricopeptide (TPR) repeat protein